jgi:hypothetical protein
MRLVYGCRQLPTGNGATPSSTTSTTSYRLRFRSFPTTGAATPGGTDLGATRGKPANPHRSPTGRSAAIAHANDLVLVTVNVKDFARFKGCR